MTYLEVSPDQEAQRRGLLFLSDDAERNWREIVAMRNEKFRDFIVPPATATGQMLQAQDFKDGTMRSTFVYLTENWERMFKGFLDACVEAGALKIIVHSKEAQADG